MESAIHDLTAGYALDALDEDERRAYEEHLETCESCRAELASFQETTEALALASAGPEPGPGLRGRILADARAERQVVVPLEPRGRWLVPVLAAASAIAAAVAVGVGIWAASLSSKLDDTRSALDVLVDPNARTVSLVAGEGRLVVDARGEAVLVLHGLERAPAGKTYETWIVSDGAPTRAGLFPGAMGTEVVSVEGRVAPGNVVAVTVEDAGGSDAPTTRPVVASRPV